MSRTTMEEIPIINIVIADDHALLRNGVKTVLQKLKKDGFHVVGEAASGEEVILQADKLQPHVILMDVEMPGIDGVDATIHIKKKHPHIGIIGLSGYNESSIVIDMLTAGAEGYLLKDTTAEEMKRAIQTVVEGGNYYTPATLPHLKKKIEQERSKYCSFPNRPLTAREIEVLQLICSGKSSKEIGVELQLSKRTIDSYREKIMAKTGARSGIEMLHYAVRNKHFKIK